MGFIETRPELLADNYHRMYVGEIVKCLTKQS